MLSGPHEQCAGHSRCGAHIRARRRPSFADRNVEAPAARAGPAGGSPALPDRGPASPREARSCDRLRAWRDRKGCVRSRWARRSRRWRQAGLVRGAPDPDDGRQTIMSLTESCRDGCAPAGRRGRIGCRAPSRQDCLRESSRTLPRGRVVEAAGRGLRETIMALTTLDPVTALIIVDLQTGSSGSASSIRSAIS